MRLDKIPKRLNTTSCAMWVKGLFSTEKKRDAKGLWVVYNAFYVIVNTVNAALKKGGVLKSKLSARCPMSAVKGPDDGRSSVVVDWERLKRLGIHQLHPVIAKCRTVSKKYETFEMLKGKPIRLLTAWRLKEKPVEWTALFFCLRN